MTVEIGDEAPDFELPDQHGTPVKLSSFRGTFVIDKEGVVRWKVVHPIPQARDIADYQKALAALG